MRGERGSVYIEFLVVLPMLIFLSFYPVELWLLNHKRDILQFHVDTFLQRAQLEGALSTSLMTDLKNSLASFGFNLALVRFDGSTPETPDGVVSKHRGETIVLNIGYPVSGLNSLKILNLSPPAAGTYMWARGTILSERP